MENLELLRILYNQLKIHSNNWSEEISGVNFIIQETYEISGARRTDVVHLLQVLEEMKMLELKSESPLTYWINSIPLEELEEKLSKGSTASWRAKNLYQLLDLIEHRPGMFLLEARLDYLYMFLSGYKLATTSNKVQFPNIEKLEEFSKFLFTQFDEEYRNSMLWYGILNNEFDSGEKGLEKFFEYMWKFRLQEKNS